VAADVLLTPYAGWCRLLRGWVVGATAIGLSAGGHAIVGGSTPTVPALILLTIAATWPCVALSRVEWTLRRLLGVLLIAQGGLHFAFIQGTHQHSVGNPPAMVAWHVAATCMSILVLTYAERALAGLITRSGLHRAVRVLEHRLELPNSLRTAERAPATHVDTCWQRLLVPVRGPPLPS